MSSINPNNIDVTYPIAGQDNDSQGFRDNFTNIKNNLIIAKTEIEDMQNKVILKSALSGTTLNNEMSNAQLKGAQLVKTTETANDLTTLTGSITIDWTEGHFQYLTTSGSITVDFDNFPTSGLYAKMRLQVTPGSTAHTLTLPSVVDVGLAQLANANVATKTISFSDTEPHLYEFSTVDATTSVTIIPLIQST